MPGPGGFRGGFHGGRGFGPGFFGRGNPILDVVTGVATGAVVAAALTPRPYRRRYAPRDGYIYVVESGRPARAVRMEEASFIISRVNIPSYTTGDNGEVQYIVEVSSYYRANVPEHLFCHNLGWRGIPFGVISPHRSSSRPYCSI